MCAAEHARRTSCHAELVPLRCRLRLCETIPVPLPQVHSHYPARRFQGVAPLTRGCSAQAWDANSSESCVLKVRFISSSDSSAGGPEGLNTQAHSEQPHPSTFCPSIHTNSRDELSSS